MIEKETTCAKLRNSLQPLFNLSRILHDVRELDSTELKSIIDEEVLKAENSKIRILDLISQIETEIQSNYKSDEVKKIAEKAYYAGNKGREQFWQVKKRLEL